MRSSRISLVRSRKSTARCSAFALRSNEPPDPGSTAIGAFVALWGFWALLAIAWAREELHLRDVVKLAPDFSGGGSRARRPASAARPMVGPPFQFRVSECVSDFLSDRMDQRPDGPCTLRVTVGTYRVLAIDNGLAGTIGN